MSIELIKYEEVISNEIKQCDSVNSLFSFMRHVNSSLKLKYICVLFKCRKMKIMPNEKHIHIEAVDTDSGEILEMNCKFGVHNFCIKNNIYPVYLLGILKKHLKF